MKNDLSKKSVPYSSGMVLKPESRWPLRLPQATVEEVLQRPLIRAPGIQDFGAAPRAGRGERVSIVVVTFNNLVFNRLCLESVLAHSAADSCELVVVDNGSEDGTADYLAELAHLNSHVRVLRNEKNEGFAVAVNQGLAASDGDILLLLNNDTIVPPNWLCLLLKGIEDPAVGMVGPVSNRCGNEAQIDVHYSSYGEFLDCAKERAQRHLGETREIRMLMMFCTAFRREVFEEIGFLDERFAIGLFEDEDYSLRLGRAGYKLLCLEDLLVNHFGQASIGKLAATGDYGQLFHGNRRKFEEKWNLKWRPHERRPNLQYRDLVSKIRLIIESTLPADSTVMIVSKGDEDLLTTRGHRAWHFPQDEQGLYAGHYPVNSAEAIEHLEELRNEGAQFLVFPATMFWWLEYYSGFATYLADTYPCIQHDETCFIYQLTGLEAVNEIEQFRLCKKARGIDRLNRRLTTIVIPFFDSNYKAGDCLEFMRRNGRHPQQWLLLLESGTDPSVAHVLEHFVDHNNYAALANIEHGKGIIAGINTGLKLAPGDVVILNPGYSMSLHWLEKMSACAFSQDAVATVTPATGKSLINTSATGNGNCVLITRAAFRRVGFLNERYSNLAEAMSEFNRRATARNFVHLKDDTTYVEAVGIDPISEWERPITQAVAAIEGDPSARPGAHGNTGRLCLLAMAHSGSGGAQVTTRDLSITLSRSYRCLLLSMGRSEWRLHQVLDGEVISCRRYAFPSPWRLDSNLGSDRLSVLEDICESFAVDLVNINHLLGGGPEVIELLAELELPVIFSFHDFYSICPTAHLVDNNGVHCGGVCTNGEGECPVNQEFIRGKVPTLKHNYVYQHRERMNSVLALCAAFTVPSFMARNRLVESMDSVKESSFHVIPHGSDLKRVQLAEEPGGDQATRLVCMGNLNEPKGLKLIGELMALNASRGRPFEFHFIGARQRGFRPEELGGVHHGPYDRKEYLQQVETIRPSFSLLAPICEETFSFTLSESWAAGIPVFASNLGALKERIGTNGGGWLLEPSCAKTFFDGMLGVLENPAAWNRAVDEIRQISIPHIDQVANKYEQLFNACLKDRYPQRLAE